MFILALAEVIKYGPVFPDLADAPCMCMQTNAKATGDQALSQTFVESAASSSSFGPRQLSVQQQQIRECEYAAKLMGVRNFPRF